MGFRHLWIWVSPFNAFNVNWIISPVPCHGIIFIGLDGGWTYLKQDYEILESMKGWVVEYYEYPSQPPNLIFQYQWSSHEPGRCYVALGFLPLLTAFSRQVSPLILVLILNIDGSNVCYFMSFSCTERFIFRLHFNHLQNFKNVYECKLKLLLSNKFNTIFDHS